ncbi:MAG: Hsp70 family protein [Deltaproteobacteria bacterium]|nr:Hsp70 family protein [Deltaproteobacteria bacterium]
MKRSSDDSGAAPSRFVVGIDLGTTNSALAYVDTEGLDERATGVAIRTLDVPQVTAAGTLEPRPLLPSFLYLATAEELASGGFALPWGAPPEGRIVGALAAKRAAEAPDRVVSSAKSWLCNERIDRTAPILPWIPDAGMAADASAPEIPRISPLDAATTYLAHLRDAWNRTMAADDPLLVLEQQDIFLTVPASFDAVARELTVRAAGDAGFANVHLLEEPQAALYAWVHGAGEDWRKDLQVGDVLLVCDVGGGTTDFSVVLVGEEGGRLALRRVAVGDHLLLGGDNMDLALAFAVRDRLARDGKRIDAWQFRGLVLACREAKERLLGESPPDSVPLSILGRGKKLIGGTIRAALERAEVDALLLDGFLPAVDASARAVTVAESGLSELGLPFAADAAITRHLATFLSSHRAVASGDDGDASAAADGLIHPTALLFNGGVMQAAAMQRRVADVLAAWAHAAKVAEPRILPGSDLSHAVARGAAYFGLARRGRGVRIRGGTARSYYVGVASAMPAVPGKPPPVKALCVVPFGVEEGSELEVPGAEFGLLVGQQARFRFFASSTRGEDHVGLVLDEWETTELEELAPLTARLDGSASSRVPVRLSATVTEIGTLELWFVAREAGERWKLEFTVRGTGGAP